MKVIDLSPEYENSYFVCFEDWSDEMREAGDHKCQWYDALRDKGLGVKIAIDNDEKAFGLIQYVPIEYSPAEGKDLYFIDCIWIYGHKEGIGNRQKKGAGKALLRAAEEDIKSRGAAGIAPWGISMPFWMKASWFKKQGYEKVDKKGLAVLLWKKFTVDAKAPSWIKEVKKPVANENPGKVTVVVFY